MATHSIILAWRIPWAEKPGEVQSTGLQSQTRLKQLSIHAYTTYSLSIHLSVDCYQLLASVNNASVNNAAINLGEPISFGDLDFNSMDIYSEVRLLSHMIVLFLILEEDFHIFPQIMYKGYNYSTSPPKFILFFFLLLFLILAILTGVR